VNLSITSSAGKTYATTTWDAGGYQINLPAGDYTVTFSGGGLAAPVTKAAKVASANVKLDLDADAPGTPPPSGGTTKTGTPGDDSLVGGGRNDSMAGSGGDDVLRGRDGRDTLRGDAGDDSLFGDGGDDVLSGGDGADRLHGGSGSDRLVGDAGADAFVFLAPAEGNDLVGDFRRAEGDKIDLSGIDADPVAAGDQAFFFADGIAFVAYQPGTVRTRQASGVTTVEADTGAGVLSFRVQGAVTLAADDFIL
jgi:serralysin